VNSEKYIGLDVHQATISVAVLDSTGKLVMESILETRAATILQFFAGLRGRLLVTFEESTCAAWLYDLLKPHVADLTVSNPRKNALLKHTGKPAAVSSSRVGSCFFATFALMVSLASSASWPARRWLSLADTLSPLRRAAALCHPQPHCARGGGTGCRLYWFRNCGRARGGPRLPYRALLLAVPLVEERRITPVWAQCNRRGKAVAGANEPRYWKAEDLAGG
jgi:hypothetical protein